MVVSVDEAWNYHMATKIDCAAGILRALIGCPYGFNPVVADKYVAIFNFTLFVVHGGDDSSVLQ